MNIFSYWEGPRPEYIQVCLDSMARVLGDDFRLVTPETVDQWLPPDTLHPAYKTLPQPALRADAIRAALLAVYGGWWWDADTVAICRPDRLLAENPGAEALYTTWTRAPLRVLNGYVWVRPGSTLSARWLEHVNRTLERDATSVDWCSLGEQLLTGLMTAFPQAVRIPRQLVLPIDIDSNVAEFFQPGKFWSMSDRAVCYGLNHSWFMYHHGPHMLLPRAEWGGSPLLIHSLLHWATQLNEEYKNA